MAKYINVRFYIEYDKALGLIDIIIQYNAINRVFCIFGDSEAYFIELLYLVKII